jgi:hypothetical protein
MGVLLAGIDPNTSQQSGLGVDIVGIGGAPTLQDRAGLIVGRLGEQGEGQRAEQGAVIAGRQRLERLESPGVGLGEPIFGPEDFQTQTPGVQVAGIALDGVDEVTFCPRRGSLSQIALG